MPAYEYSCDNDHLTVLAQSIHEDLAGEVECGECGERAKRRFGVPKFNFDGGRQMFHDTTLAAERRAELDGLDHFLSHGNEEGLVRDDFRWSNRAELV